MKVGKILLKEKAIKKILSPITVGPPALMMSFGEITISYLERWGNMLVRL